MKNILNQIMFKAMAVIKKFHALLVFTFLLSVFYFYKESFILAIIPAYIYSAFYVIFNKFITGNHINIFKILMLLVVGTAVLGGLIVIYLEVM